jgi:mono/diheme cytochrome c family protein
MRNLSVFVSVAILAACLSGCSTEKKAEFEPNLVAALASEMEIGYPMEQALNEAQVALEQYFGTPDQPNVPEFLDEELAGIVSKEHLMEASGPADTKGRGLYRKHCVSCHGVTGNGRGTNAAISNPYPRDFRMGKFKFKSTARGAKPLKEDLAWVIRNGISGTTMVRIPELSEEDIQALVDYVIHLSWRGEVERELIRQAEDIEFESEAGDELRNLYAPGSHLFEEEQLPLVQETIEQVARSWAYAPTQVKQVPDAGDTPVDASLEELRSAARSSQDSELKASIERGRELFVSESAACAKCHGPSGAGDGQTQDYDEWTKDWTLRVNVNPEDDKALIPFLARGALPPRKILPRDFREGVYRGGSEPERIYHRIAYGIDGTPMPSIEGVVSPEDIWHLVNYVRSLSQPDELAAN